MASKSLGLNVFVTGGIGFIGMFEIGRCAIPMLGTAKSPDIEPIPHLCRQSYSIEPVGARLQGDHHRQSRQCLSDRL